MAKHGGQRSKNTTRIIKIQMHQAWSNMIEMLTACHESRIMLALHLSDNGMKSFMSRAIMHAQNFNVKNMEVDDMPEFQLIQEICDTFNLDVRTLVSGDKEKEKKMSKREGAKLVKEVSTKMVPDYAGSIRKLHVERLQNHLDDEAVREKFAQDGGPEYLKNLEQFLKDNDGLFEAYRSNRRTAQKMLYELMIQQQLRFVKKKSKTNASKIESGFSRRNTETDRDDFVLSRPSSSCIEMIFNRQYHLDRYWRGQLHRYFQPDQPLRWEFSDHETACPVCRKHTMVLIFFNQAYLD